MKESFLMNRIVNVEYLFAAVLTGIFFVDVAEFGWWWLILLFPLFDASAVGYLHNNRTGALLYNLAHSLVGPAIIVGLYILQGEEWQLFLGTLWLFHNFVDRALGYGLKHTDGFGHTHLGKIGKTKKVTRTPQVTK